MVRTAIIGILAIFIISVFSVVYINSFTGSYTAMDYALIAGNPYNTAPHIYGGAIKKAMKDSPYVFGKAYGDQMSKTMAEKREQEKILLYQEYLYAHKDKWDCTFGKEAETSKWPCVFDEEKQKYCCIVVH